ncbi:MAG: BrnA antitoxin family protein [Syntrophales bacterium]|nr:BrnA antitoxin family protein [Syntrophales bacterium]MDD5641998.1 BrnA antitoxin family protein [Syntrophales bacterium]
MKAKRGTDWDRLRQMSDAAMHAAVEADPDAHPTDEAFWEDAKVVMPRRKEVITIRLDADLLAWFRQQPGYQTRINAILRTFMNAHAHK